MRSGMYALKLRFEVGCLLLLCWFVPISARETPDTGDAVPALTIDEAVRLAIANNRDLKIVALQLDSSKEKLAVDKTRRLPSTSSYFFVSQSLTTLSFTIPAGTLGVYSATGPIPAKNTPISAPPGPTAFVTASISQPLLTLYKINLRVHGGELNVEQAATNLLAERLDIVDQVRQVYYSVMQGENAVEAAKASIKQYEELDRITLQYVSEKVALQSENLEVKAKLAEQEYSLLQFQDKVQSGKETLNNLVGRDITIDFHTVQVTELSSIEEDLQAARAKAVAQNPQVKQAQIGILQAENQRRQAKAQYMPDFNAAFHYLSPFGIDYLPTNFAGIGVELNWEPWDWNRRKHEVAEKTIGVEQSKLKLDETNSQVLIKVDNQYRALHEARAAVLVAKAAQESAKEKLREVTLQYQKKTALLRDVLQQESSLESANSSYNEAMAEFWIAKANFMKAIGEE